MRAGAAAALATFTGMLGFGIGYFWASKKWSKLCDEEVESVKQTLRCRFSTVLDEDKIEENLRTGSEPTIKALDEYKELTKDYISKPEPTATDDEDSEWNVYTVKEFEELDIVPRATDMGYGTLYSDDVWTMDDDEPMVLAQRIETFGSAERINQIRDILVKEGCCYIETPYGWYEMTYDNLPYDDEGTHPRPKKVVIEDEDEE